ncbi:MAG: hypothetical protein U1E65_17580 [Myxococcota bacterium]
MFLAVAPIFGGCATVWQANRLEEKVDQLIKNTQRETMREIFGEQATAITEKVDAASTEQKGQINNLLTEYQKGNASIEDVRSSVVTTLGGADRVVSTSGGMWIRDESGKKIGTVGRNIKLKKCERLKDDDVPATIANNKGLANFSWGRAEVNGKTVIFPWELTMSSFAKEIVENTARRTAEEFIRMGGEKAFRRPVQIQVVTDPGQQLKINYDGVENEVYVNGDSKQADPNAAPAPASTPAPSPSK